MSRSAAAPAVADSEAVEAAVSVRDLTKRYGPLVAVNGLSLEVPRGAAFALVGPNGAGKTTTMECVVGLKTPDAGEVRVLGHDPQHNRERMFKRVGVQLQEDSMYGRIRVSEIMSLFASFFDDPLPADELLTRFGLAEKKRAYFSSLSGGQKRRAGIALALLGKPELVLLDEPTSGLDPHGRRRLWATIKGTCAAGATLILTTHLLQEAEEHCDAVAMVDHGRVVAVGSPQELMRRHRLRTRVSCPVSPNITVERLRRIPGVTNVETSEGKFFVYSERGNIVDDIGQLMMTQGADPAQLEVRAATLEDLYLTITGREYVVATDE